MKKDDCGSSAMQCGKEGKQKNRNKGGKNKTRNRFCGYVPSVILMLVFFFLALVAVLFGCDQRAKAIAFVVLCGSIDTYLFSEDQDLILVFIRLRRDHHHHHHLVNLSDSPPSPHPHLASSGSSGINRSILS